MDVRQAINVRRSVREYSPQPLPPDLVQRLKAALRSAPSACNYQPWRFLLVFDADLRQRVARACRERMWIAGAPLIVVACGLPASAYPRMAGKHNSADIDVAIAVDHLTLAAVEEGLGTCWLGAFDEDAVKGLLGVPADVRVVAMTPVGYPAASGLNRPLNETDRKPPADIFSVDRW
jgi:nitroreductase